MTQEIQAIRFDVQDIGKHVKSSKKRFSWTFGLNNRNHTIILDFSFISGKVKLVVDRKTAIQTEIPANTSFQHPFTLDGYALNILQQGQSFELRINNKVFSHIYTQAKTNTQFRNYEDEIKDIKVNQSTFQNTGKTVKLNIGAFDGMKKKTKQSVQSDNWGNFGGSDMGIPSYFGQSTTQPSTIEKKQVKKASSLLDEDDTETSNHSNLVFQQKAEQKKTQIDFFADEPKKVVQQPVQLSYNTINKQNRLDDFNTMQRMFATMNVQNTPSTKQESSLDLLNSSMNQNPQGTVNPKQYGTNFNTMQNLFATNAQNPTQNPVTLDISGNPSKQVPNFANIQPNTYQSNNFYTIGNLFATNAHPQTVNPLSTQNLVQQPKAVNGPNDFSTMQNLFSTSNYQNPIANQPQVGSTNIQDINLNDFNTMQNLFKTGTGIGLPPPQNPTVNKQEDPFALLGIAQTTPSNNKQNLGAFNTYSGAKTNMSPTLDASSFGTMQKGGQIGNIDFFQNLPTQPKTAQQAPNFSKKKSSPLEDLI